MALFETVNTTKISTKLPEKSFVATPEQLAKGVKPQAAETAEMNPKPFLGKE